MTSTVMPIACNRKRKDMEEGEDEMEPIFERRSGFKGIRRGINLPECSEEAQFHALPEELNLQLLANLGYNVNTNQHTGFSKQIINGRTSNHSPSSSESDIYPSTPIDNMAGSVESYFTKGIRSETCDSVSYPNFDIYPGHIYARPPGLMGMQMTQSKSTQSFDSDPDGMDVDGEQIEDDVSLHGDHCKSIPQLLCRGSGPHKELWARCHDCGVMSPVDCPSLSKPLPYGPLAYSP